MPRIFLSSLGMDAANSVYEGPTRFGWTRGTRDARARHTDTQDTMLGSKRRRIDVFANGSTSSRCIRLPDPCDNAELVRLAANKLGRAVPGAPEIVRFFLRGKKRGREIDVEDIEDEDEVYVAFAGEEWVAPQPPAGAPRTVGAREEPRGTPCPA